MEEIKLLSDQSPQFDLENHHPPSPLKLRKGNHREKVESIDPWMEEQDDIPFTLFRSEHLKRHIQFSPDKTEKISVSSKAILFPAKSWKSLQKGMKGRQLRQLPVLDVGKYSSIKKSIYPGQSKRKPQQYSPESGEGKKTFRENYVNLPAVERELSIERKIFLLKRSGEEMGSTRLRRIISQGLH